MTRDNRSDRYGDRSDNRIVAVGLLTARDLDVLGTGFKRVYPVDEDTAFDDLLARIDALTTGEDAPASGARR